MKPSLILAIASSLSAVSAAPAQANTIVLHPPEHPPETASQIVDRHFLGYAFEATSFIKYLGPPGQPNNFSINMLNNLAEKNEIRPYIRVGGTSLDHSKFDKNQKEPATRPPDEDHLNIPRHATLGPAYFESFNHFDAQYTIDLPFSRENISNTITMAKSAKERVKSNIYAFELGNEPNYYEKQGERENWNGAAYAKQWKEYVSQIGDAIGLGPWMWQGPSVGSSDVTKKVTEWSIQNLVENGLTSSNDLNALTLHYYQTQAGYGLVPTLMNHTATVGNYTEYFKPTADYIKQNFDGMPFVINEIGSSLPKVVDGIQVEDWNQSSVLGAALWTVDYMLYMMSQSVDRINMQDGVNFQYAPWQPVEFNNSGPNVAAPYYGYTYIADFIGSVDGLRVDHIDLNSPHYAAYAGYQLGQLSKLSLINMNYWNGTDASQRPSTSFRVPIPDDVSTVQVKRLKGPGAGAFSEITWAGMKYSYDNLGIGQQVGDEGESVTPKGSQIEVTVPDSEAVLVLLNY